MANEKKVLIITYYWPPSGGPGVQRWLKLANYLSQNGVEVHVLTVDPDKASYPVRDESLTKDVHPAIAVHSTTTFEILSLYKKVNSKKDLPMSGFANQVEKLSMKEKLMRFIRGNFFIPDARKGWNKHALPKALELIRKHAIQHVITTGPPHSTHLIGLNIKKNIPTIQWVADFRDPWADVFYNQLMNRTQWAKNKDIRLQNKVLTTADLILTVSEHLKSLLLSYLSPDKASVIHVLPNGYDPKDFEGIIRQASPKKKLVYLGTGTTSYPFSSVLEALSSSAISTLKPTFELIGSYDAQTRQLLNGYSEKVHLVLHPYVNHQEVPQLLVNADLLILLIPSVEQNKLIVTGKIFEYMASNTPILGVGPTDGDAAKILEETGTGKMFEPDDIQGIRDFMHAALTGNFHIEKNASHHYSRAQQAVWLKELMIRG